MTLSEIRRSDLDFLYPKDVCEVLQCHPYSINVQAKEDPAKLGFPVTIIVRVFVRGVWHGDHSFLMRCYRRSGMSERPQR